MPVQLHDANLEQRILRLQQVVCYLHTVVAPDDVYLLALSHRLNMWIGESSRQETERAVVQTLVLPASALMH